jgi:hypothetical protein
MGVRLLRRHPYLSGAWGQFSHRCISVADATAVQRGATRAADYPDSGRGESCLMAGFADTGRPIYAVCRRQGD